MKYVLVTGGVVSGLGKGVTASSIGLLLQACGLRVTSIKIGIFLIYLLWIWLSQPLVIEKEHIYTLVCTYVHGFILRLRCEPVYCGKMQPMRLWCHGRDLKIFYVAVAIVAAGRNIKPCICAYKSHRYTYLCNTCTYVYVCIYEIAI